MLLDWSPATKPEIRFSCWSVNGGMKVPKVRAVEQQANGQTTRSNDNRSFEGSFTTIHIQVHRSS